MDKLQYLCGRYLYSYGYQNSTPYVLAIIVVVEAPVRAGLIINPELAAVTVSQNCLQCSCGCAQIFYKRRTN